MCLHGFMLKPAEDNDPTERVHNGLFTTVPMYTRELIHQL